MTHYFEALIVKLASGTRHLLSYDCYYRILQDTSTYPSDLPIGFINSKMYKKNLKKTGPKPCVQRIIRSNL